MTDPKPEYLTETDKETIKRMDGETEAQQHPREPRSPMEDAGASGGTAGTGTDHTQNAD